MHRANDASASSFSCRNSCAHSRATLVKSGCDVRASPYCCGATARVPAVACGGDGGAAAVNGLSAAYVAATPTSDADADADADVDVDADADEDKDDEGEAVFAA